MLTLCDALRALTASCSSGREDAAAREDPARAKELALLRAGASGHTAALPQALRRSVRLRAGSQRGAALEDAVGFELEPSGRPDFRASVAAVATDGAAAAAGVKPDALLIAIDGRSTRGWSLQQVRGALQRAVVPSALSAYALASSGYTDFQASDVTVEFAQYIEAANVAPKSMDKNPYALTHFPSPQGEQLPGVNRFLEDSEQETAVPAASEEECEASALPLHRRERSRSFKHFWMSDRSSKACYECEQLFTFFRRRHHCRSCGQLFCSNCCARLPQSFGGNKVDDSIARLRKQLVCHTCHLQLREGLHMKLTGATFETEGVAKSSDSSTSQTLLLMPQHITEALERSSSDTAQWKHVDKSELFDRDEISSDPRPSDQPDKSNMAPVLFTMFPKVQIKASVQHLAHQPHLHELGKDTKQRGRVVETRPRALSETVIVPMREHIRKEAYSRSFNKLKRCNSSSYIGNPSIHRWSEAEFKRLVAQSHAEARIAGTFPSSSKSVASNRPKALSANFDTTHFGNSVNIDPFGVGSSNGTGGSGVERLRNNTLTNYAESERIAIKDSKILSVIGLSDDACDAMKDPEWRRRKEDVLQEMAQHAQTRLEERIFHMLEHSSEISRLFMVEQHRWMQIINLFTNRAATQVSCEPDRGDTMDIMEYVRVQCLEGGRVQDSFFIDGVMVHKSLARKGMRSDILKPRILLLATALDYQRKKEAISSLESVAGQEVEYMHIVTEKILTLRPDIVMFEGHVHRVAEELLFKANVALVKNVRLIDLQRIARCTGASILTSYDHIDKMSDKGIIGTCARFYVMISDQAPKSAKRISYKMSSPSMAQHVVKPPPPNGTDSDRWSTSSTTSAGTDQRPHRRRRVQRQNIVFEGGQSSKGCTLCLRGGSPEVFSEVTEILGATIRAAYNMRLQRAVLAEYGYVPPPEQLERSVAEEWFAKCSTSLYISLKSNSLSMRAALKETQSMCKWCKAHTRYNNISSLRVLSTNRDRENGEATGSVLGGGVEMNQCTCGSKASYTLRDRILFSTCWSTIEGKSASKAELMCIDFYSSNDISLGQFFDKFCFDGSKSEFKRAFTTCKLSFSHDTGRITFRVKDLSAIKDQNEKLMPAADLLRDINHRAVLRLVRSDKLVLWSRNIADENNPTSTSNPLSVQYSILPRDVRNYSFGKFLEDLFYGKAMSIDVNRFPHLAGVIGSRDPSLVRFFSCRGRVVSVQFEPLEPVLHVALQPALWQDHVDHEQQLVAVHELCELAREVYVVTTSKIAESMADPVTAFHAKHNLKILRNEVQQWYSCFASKLESNPPQHVFEHNAHFKQIYDYGVRWSLRITQAVQATVRPTLKDQTNSPKSTLPRAWFNQLPQSANLVGQSPFVPAPTSTSSSTIDVQEPGNLENLASFARSLAQARLNGNSTPVGFSHVANEVSNTLRRRNGNVLPELAEAWSMEENFDANDETSRSFPNESLDSESLSGNLSVFPRAASTIGSLGSKKALESFRRMRQQKGDELGYLKLPKRLLAWHPSLPSGINNKVVLVNASQPTSVVAYSLYSKEYAKCVNDYIRREASNAAATSTMSVSSDPDDEVTRSMLRILRAPARTNVDHSFADENQFQAATTRFSCKSYYAMQFHALRHLYYGGDRNYVESLCECQQWNAAGGKSGAGFLKTRDERFIAKAIPEIELQMFLSMANEYFSYMAKTFENDLSSMLSKVLGIYKVSILQGDHEQKMCVVVMENLLYGREVNFSFDLKGKMEGRYKDVDAGDSRPVLWDRNFVEMAGGIPLPLQESAMSLLLSAIMNDTGFLASVQATDYSMLVGYDVNKQEIVASIIDYIHKYDFMKMMEHAGKRLIQEEGEITVLNPKHYRKRFCRAMTRYFVTIPSRYTKVTTVSSSRTAMNGLPPIAGSGYGSGFGMVMNSSVGSTGTVTNTAGEDDRDDSSQYGYWSGLNSALSTPMNAAADFSRNGRTW